MMLSQIFGKKTYGKTLQLFGSAVSVVLKIKSFKIFLILVFWSDLVNTFVSNYLYSHKIKMSLIKK